MTASAASAAMAENQHSGDPYRLLTIAEAAEFLRISRSQLNAMISDGRLPVRPIVIGERRRLFPLWALIGWICRETGAPLPPAPVILPSKDPGY